jgi:HSP20 family molecular chaperone IbpA
MSNILRRDPKTVVPGLIDWFEAPFASLRPYLAQPIRVEEYAEEGRYVVKAELAGINPEKDAEVTVGAGYLTIRAERHASKEGARRSEFRYGAFSRTLSLPADANPDDVTATYADGILTVTIGTRESKAGQAKKIAITTAT